MFLNPVKIAYHHHIQFQYAPIPPIPLSSGLPILVLEKEEGQDMRSALKQ